MNHASGLPKIIALTLLLAAAITAHAKPQKVDVCHVPPGNPENAHTISVNQNAVPAHLAHGDLLGACPPTAAELDPPEIAVDTSLLPVPLQIAGVDGGVPRDVIRMNSDIGPGYQFDFVANEVFLISDQPEELDRFMRRSRAELLFRISLPTPGALETNLYLLRVDPSGTDTSQLNQTLASLEPQLHGEHQVSSEGGLSLLAFVANEIKNHRLRLGINILLRGDDLAERRTEEAAVGTSVSIGSTSFTYTRNGFEWPFMERDPDDPSDALWPLDTGTAEALRVVEATGRFVNRVRVLIADGGFYPNADFPPYTNIGPLRTPFTDPTTCGGTGPVISPACAAHGTHVTLAGFGLPDNQFGTFGPGGPVTDLVILQMPAVDFSSVARFIVDAIPGALALAPRIINLSAGTSVPGGFCFIACEPFDWLAGRLDSRGILFVASAGNDAINVDATDEICVFGCIRFEEAAIIPCETDNVFCVGATDFQVSVRASYSNFGTATDANSVDIYAPGNIYSVTALNADETASPPVDDLSVITGTSFSAPYAAGVLALTAAANPFLTHAQVRSCVMSTAHTESFAGISRRINTLGAVQCAMGETHPFIDIVAPRNSETFRRGTDSVVLQANADDLEDGSALSISWFSSLDGLLGNSLPGNPLTIGPLELQLGDHEICARTTDSSGRTVQDCIQIQVLSSVPIISILQPVAAADPENIATYSQSSTIVLSGTAFDPDGPPPTNIQWFITPIGSSRSSTPVAIGTLNASVRASAYAPGDYYVSLVVEDISGAVAFRRVDFRIVENSGTEFPVITLSAPVSGTSYLREDPGPITIPLRAFAEDAEDGTIPFESIEWFIRTDGGPEQPLTVAAFTVCVELDPFGGCIRFGTTYSFDVDPDENASSTRYDIKGRVRDSDMNLNEEINGITTIFILQLI